MNKLLIGFMGKSKKSFGKMGGTPIDTTILVFMAFCLAGGTLLIFYLNGNQISSKISDSRFLDITYVSENQINFYINEMMDKSLTNVYDKNNPVPEFINNFKKELEKYKFNETYILDELVQLENQINENNIQFVNGKIIFSVNINLKQDFEGKFIINYNYNKKFIKNI